MEKKKKFPNNTLNKSTLFLARAALGTMRLLLHVILSHVPIISHLVATANQNMESSELHNGAGAAGGAEGEAGVWASEMLLFIPWLEPLAIGVTVAFPNGPLPVFPFLTSDP